MAYYVQKYTLENGLTVLMVPQHTVPKVSMQLWYDVGAKDETSGKRGAAHFIEHMIFKGTQSLSESDINKIVYKLSGSCNAFTSHDYTGYLFEMPSQHWHKVLPIMADCMQYCTFDPEQLSSEVRAILQEVRLYRDDYTTTALEYLTQSIFIDHPYHHPIIGYRDDLLRLDQESIKQFYKNFYMPNNATLVVVGDITPEDAIQQVEASFGQIPRGVPAHDRTWSHQQDITSRSITLYRDVQQPMVMLTWEVPGFKEQQSYLWDILSWILGAGKGSRLYKRLMTERDLVTDIQTFVYDLFEHGQFVVYFQPRDLDQVATISNIILEEIDACRQGSITEQEIERAKRKTKMDFVSVFEDFERHAYLLGKFYLATGDEHALYRYTQFTGDIREHVQSLANGYLRSSVMNTAQVLPIPEPEQAYLHQLQEEADQQEEALLAGGQRESDVEPTSCAVNIEPEPVPTFDYPKPEVKDFANGMRLFTYHKDDVDKIEIVFDFKAKHYFDPDHKQGRYLFMTELLLEGTTSYSANELAEEIERHGMHIHIMPGTLHLTVLPEDISKGLELLTEILYNATFDSQAIERVRPRLLSDIQRFWDSPAQFVNQKLRDAVYGEHPYHRNILGTQEAIEHMSREDIMQAYADYIVPDQTRVAIVGNFRDFDIAQLVEQYFGEWTGKKAADITYPELTTPQPQVIDTHINRDQTVICYGSLSVRRRHEDFDALLLFDQNLTGGVLDGMHSQLFTLREQSGLFYAAGGSLLAGTGTEPGMIIIKALVSNDRLQKAQEQIENLIERAPLQYTQEDHEEAQRALINTFSDHFATQLQTAHTFIILDRYGLPFDHFDKRPQQLRSLDYITVQETAQKYMKTSRFVTVRAGRVHD